MRQESKIQKREPLSNEFVYRLAQRDSRTSDLVRRLACELLDAREACELLSKEKRSGERNPSMVLVTVEQCGAISAHTLNASCRIVIEPAWGNLAGEIERTCGRFWAGMLAQPARPMVFIEFRQRKVMREIAIHALQRAEKEKNAALRDRYLRLARDAWVREVLDGR